MQENTTRNFRNNTRPQQPRVTAGNHERYLANARRNNRDIALTLLNSNTGLSGKLLGFDKYTLTIGRGNSEIVVFKSAIETMALVPERDRDMYGRN